MSSKIKINFLSFEIQKVNFGNLFLFSGIELLFCKLQKKFDKSGLELEQDESRLNLEQGESRLNLEVEQGESKLKGGRDGSSRRYRVEWGHNSTFKVKIIFFKVTIFFLFN